MHIANKLGISRQAFDKLLDKKQFSVDDANKILNIIGYNIENIVIQHGKRDICKTGFTFKLGSNGKAQKDVKRNVAVIPAFVRQNLCKKICKSPFFQCKDDVIYQIGE